MKAHLWDRARLNAAIHSLRSCLCVGLDTDFTRLPPHLKEDKDGILVFNKSIIDHTLPYTVAYKINAAFYECLGQAGWNIMEQTIEYVRSKDRFAILDAKRGDIGNTGEMYARAAFDVLKADGVTVSPYMGKDSIDPFLKYHGHWTILLGLTSNAGAEDFQLKKMSSGHYLFEEVITSAKLWASQEQLMFVVGATQSEYLIRIRQIVPDYFLLIPGIGAQGGDLDDVIRCAFTSEGDILINSSRNIIYASAGEDYAYAAGLEAEKVQKKMAKFI